jgi:hypothetical protein
VQEAIQKVVAQRAEEVARELVNTDQWTERIKAEVTNGWQHYLQQLSPAVTRVLIESLHGKDGSYGYAGRILAYLKRPV